jgi:hypothetical protein
LTSSALKRSTSLQLFNISHVRRFGYRQLHILFRREGIIMNHSVPASSSDEYQIERLGPFDADRRLLPKPINGLDVNRNWAQRSCRLQLLQGAHLKGAQ